MPLGYFQTTIDPAYYEQSAWYDRNSATFFSGPSSALAPDSRDLDATAGEPAEPSFALTFSGIVIEELGQVDEFDLCPRLHFLHPRGNRTFKATSVKCMGETSPGILSPELKDCSIPQTKR